MAGTVLFISHAHRDADLAAKLVTALEVGLEVPPDSIRCTSVDGYKLDLGAMPADALARELNATGCVVAMVTVESLASQWVLFELGATWALAKSWIPLLGAGVGPDDLPGPLRGAAAASLTDEAGLRAARSQIAATLRWATNGTMPLSDRLLREVAELAGARRSDDVQQELRAKFGAKRAKLGPTQGKLVDLIANGPGRREFSLEEIAAAFPGIEGNGELYYRLEQLRYLGFLRRGGVSPAYRWSRSDAYGVELGIPPSGS